MKRLFEHDEQIKKLNLVATIALHAECNFVIIANKGDAAYIQAVDTPKASQIVHPIENEGYDVWKWKSNGYCIGETGISAERAAEIMVGEYLHAKAKRVKKLYPNLSLTEIMATLSKGYQRGSPSTKAH